MDPALKVDYRQVEVEEGDLILLTTDGITGSLSHDQIEACLSAWSERAVEQNSEALDKLANTLCEAALQNDSRDNLTCGLMHVESLSRENMDEAMTRLQRLKIPPVTVSYTHLTLPTIYSV